MPNGPIIEAVPFVDDVDPPHWSIGESSRKNMLLVFVLLFLPECLILGGRIYPPFRNVSDAIKFSVGNFRVEIEASCFFFSA